MHKKIVLAFLTVTLASCLTWAAVLEVNVPNGTEQKGFTAEQIAEIKALTAADEIKKTGGGALLVKRCDGIGDFKGTLRIAEGCYVPTRGSEAYDTVKGPLGMCGEAQVIVESGATLFFDLYTQVLSNNFWGVKIRLTGNGAAGQAGALVLGGQWGGSTEYNGFYPCHWNIVLGGPTTISKGASPGHFQQGCSIDMKGYDLTVVNNIGLKGLECVTNAGHILSGGRTLTITSGGSIAIEVPVAAGVVQTNLTASQLADFKAMSWDQTRNDLQKTGEGVLRITDDFGLGAMNLWNVHVSGGVYLMSSLMGYSGPFGKIASTCTVFVEDGATLYFDEYFSDSPFIDGLTLHLAGNGYPGIGGALVLGGNWNPGDTAWHADYPYGWKVILDADATIHRGYSNAYFGYKENALSTIDLGGHTLVIDNTRSSVYDRSSGGFDLRGVGEILNPGKIVLNGQNPVRLGPIVWHGDDSNELVLTNGASILFYKPSTPDWTLRLTGTGDLSVDAGWTGPVAIGNPTGTLLLKPAANAELLMMNNITGAGGVRVEGGNYSRVVFSGNNSYAGKTTLTRGSLIFMHKGSAPGWDDASRLVGVKSDVDGIIAFAKRTDGRQDGWTAEEMVALYKRFRFNGTADRNWGIGTYVDPDDDFTIDFDFCSFQKNDAMIFQTFGGGRTVLRGDFPKHASVTPFRDNFDWKSSGYGSSNLVYSATHPESNVWTAPNGTSQRSDYTLENVGTYYMGTWIYRYLVGVTGDYSRPQRLTVGTNTCTDCARAYGGRSLYACGNDDDCSAVITLENGGIISNNVWIASCSTAGRKGQVGAYIQRGGALRAFLPSGVDNGLLIGGSDNGLGYAEIDGGEFSVGVDTPLTIGNLLGSKAIFRQKGGVVDVAKANWGRGGQVEIRFSGGICEVADLAYVPNRGGNSGDAKGIASMVFDSGVRPEFKGGFALAYRTDSTGIVSCVSEAVVETPFVRRATNRGTDKSAAFVNFNGGGICATQDGAELLGAGDQAVDQAVVYAAGAILEAKDGVSATVSTPLEKPTGRGIAALSSDAFPVRGAVGSGYVIIRGDGVGATASVIYDSTKWEERITGVEITSPGTGYTWAEAEIFTGSYVANIPLAVTLAEAETSGGLTKVGPGTIVLNAANTYGGATTLAEGTLKLGVVDALPFGSMVKCTGGTLDAAGADVSGLTFDVTGLLFNKGDRYILACHAVGLPTFVGIPKDWAVTNANGTIKLREQRGLALIVR